MAMPTNGVGSSVEYFLVGHLLRVDLKGISWKKENPGTGKKYLVMFKLGMYPSGGVFVVETGLQECCGGGWNFT